MEPLLAHKPLVSCRGNHEIEILLSADNATMTAAAARYPYPQDPTAATLATGPNVGAWFVQQTDTTFATTAGHGWVFRRAFQLGVQQAPGPGQR